MIRSQPQVNSIAPARPLMVCLTGGGSAGHVTPHFALLSGINRRGWRVFYIGSNGLERPLAEAQGLDYETIAAGKLRRYLSLRNLVDVFRVGIGILQAFRILRHRQPDAVFSKGGFVAAPVAIAAWLLKIPVVSHESDLTPGLANRLISRFASVVLYTFPETRQYLGPAAVCVGAPVREELFLGNRACGLAACGFDAADPSPTVLVMGGSLGSQRLNETLRAVLPSLLVRLRVIHITGQGKRTGFSHARYKEFEFVREGLNDLFAAADLFLGRAGSNSIFEALALRKPMLLVPLELGSRGDQVLNAEYFARNGWASVLKEKDLSSDALESAVIKLLNTADDTRARQSGAVDTEAAERILNIIGNVFLKQTRE